MGGFPAQPAFENGRTSVRRFWQKFTIYCFRNSYATWQLQEKDAFDIYTLAINTRTSIEMIQNYYSHLKAEQKANVLRGKQIGDL